MAAAGTPLEALYATVPAAEEEDLLEQHERDRRRRQDEDLAPWRCVGCGGIEAGVHGDEMCCAGDSPADDGAADDTADDDGWHVTPAQALRLVEHELGARVVDEGSGNADR